MSMNLHCDDVDLWQTPTYITYMCMSFDENGNPDGGMEGVRKRYLMWVQSRLNGVWHEAQEHEAMRNRVREHCELVQSLKNPEFRVL